MVLVILSRLLATFFKLNGRLFEILKRVCIWYLICNLFNFRCICSNTIFTFTFVERIKEKVTTLFIFWCLCTIFFEFFVNQIKISELSVRVFHIFPGSFNWNCCLLFLLVSWNRIRMKKYIWNFMPPSFKNNFSCFLVGILKNYKPDFTFIIKKTFSCKIKSSILFRRSGFYE